MSQNLSKICTQGRKVQSRLMHVMYVEYYVSALQYPVAVNLNLNEAYINSSQEYKWLFKI